MKATFESAESAARLGGEGSTLYRASFQSEREREYPNLGVWRIGLPRILRIE